MQPKIHQVEDAKKEFYMMIERAAGEKRIDAGPHRYLTELLTNYTRLGSEGPSVNTKDAKAFCLQIADVEEEFPVQRHMRYRRFKAIGDTLLFGVGFIPETVSSIYRANNRNTERPPLEYYASLGTTAYSRAAKAIYQTELSNESGGNLIELARNFKRYAGLLFKVREECEGLPIERLDILLNMVRLTKEEAIMDPFTVRNPILDIKETKTTM